ncbi:uncharacterized protein LOC143622966 isoform X2 [Bidens hawaiensis]|uniref:uncharacterized protein LOC143622966 isoform X2 n=1 Tax=Bidens hawaiensis TaxID=980011 RepID=UPI00404AF079
MGHRHVFSPSFMLETDNNNNDHRWNLIEPPCALTETGAAESSSLAYPANNMSIEGEHCSNTNPAPVSNAYSSLVHNVQNLHYLPDASGPSNLHENYGNVASSSSSNYNKHPVNEDDNARWQRKRKSPADTNGYDNLNNSSSSSGSANDIDINGGSTSEICIPTNPWEETQNMHIFHTPWGYPNVKRGHEGESFVRNVRSRVVSSGHELIPFSNATENGIITRGNGVQSTQVQSDRGSRGYYIQRSSSLQLGHSDEGLQLGTEGYPSPHVRPNIAWRSNDRNARARISLERYQAFNEEASFHDRSMHEGFMIVDRSAFGSRSPFDHHQDMRLDIDDMSYEELLALGERIGSVNTGLSESLISKCLRESIYCSSDQIQDEGTCVICLEEYANMDDVGMLKGCKHDFHVGCIKKWLSMKNLCPICKSDSIKQK